jgi:hypothetical protein
MQPSAGDGSKRRSLGQQNIENNPMHSSRHSSRDDAAAGFAACPADIS